MWLLPQELHTGLQGDLSQQYHPVSLFACSVIFAAMKACEGQLYHVTKACLSGDKDAVSVSLFPIWAVVATLTGCQRDRLSRPDLGQCRLFTVHISILTGIF